MVITPSQANTTPSAHYEWRHMRLRVAADFRGVTLSRGGDNSESLAQTLGVSGADTRVSAGNNSESRLAVATRESDE